MNIQKDNPQLIEFALAHDVLRHDCVRIRSVLWFESLIAACAILFAFWTKFSESPQKTYIACGWCYVSLCTSVFSSLAILKARSGRRRLVGRVNYLRRHVFSKASLNTAQYEHLANFSKEIIPSDKFFLMPQLLGAVMYVIASCFAFVLALT